MQIKDTNNNSELKEISREIKELISTYQDKYSLSFIEDTHTYFIKKLDGNITSDFPSVSSVLKCFYREFVPENTKAFKNCEGDKQTEILLLEGWKKKGDHATNLGSRVHFLLETYLVKLYGEYKKVRQPIFTCDKEQIEFGDQMIIAGKNFIDLMHKRGAVLLDTETVLGSLELEYFGQPDKLWLINNKKGIPGLLITDWKTNAPKNFEVHSYTGLMLPPFESHYDTALAHYYIQLPLYGKLFINMLKGTKYENLPLLGAIVVLLKRDGTFEEYKSPMNVINTILDMDVKHYLNNQIKK